ncbi:urease accessory protein UreF [Ketobacter sp.]|uniref:urease accessory protein UreF n=1 Tax=Ketobacter sp. TaxID=2083498 RepID=UPI0025B94B28|nr:urease accessory UreF family protein [Ketobacter sp.]
MAIPIPMVMAMLTAMITNLAITTMNIDQLQLLQLLQLTSPSLPIGGFSWSQGTETAIEQGWLQGEADYARWLEGIIGSAFVNQEWPLLRKLQQAWQMQDLEQVRYWNQYALALRETKELHLEDTQMGAALLRLMRDLDYARAALWSEPGTSYLTAFAMAATEKKIPLDAAAIGLAWSWLENQIAAALKTFPMGQTAGQRIFHHIAPLLPDLLQQSMTVQDEDIGCSLPGVVLASMQHERQYSRLFRS